MTPKTVKDTTEGGLPIRDLFAFAGVRQIIGDPHGKLMQDEVADRIQKLVNVLREMVGLMDSLKIAATAPAMTKTEAMTMGVCYRSIEATLNEAMPEWDAVCKQIYEANVASDQRRMRQLLAEIEMHCSCGARPEAVHTHKAERKRRSDLVRLEVYCASAGCSWAGDYDETTWSLKDDLTGQIVECGGEDPRGERCCPRCLLTNLVDTEGWDDDQLPRHAFRLPNA
jgi:hypothetical protein